MKVDKYYYGILTTCLKYFNFMYDMYINTCPDTLFLMVTNNKVLSGSFTVCYSALCTLCLISYAFKRCTFWCQWRGYHNYTTPQHACWMIIICFLLLYKGLLFPFFIVSTTCLVLGNGFINMLHQIMFVKKKLFLLLNYFSWVCCVNILCGSYIASQTDNLSKLYKQRLPTLLNKIIPINFPMIVGNHCLNANCALVNTSEGDRNNILNGLKMQIYKQTQS